MFQRLLTFALIILSWMLTRSSCQAQGMCTGVIRCSDQYTLTSCAHTANPNFGSSENFCKSQCDISGCGRIPGCECLIERSKRIYTGKFVTRLVSCTGEASPESRCEDYDQEECQLIEGCSWEDGSEPDADVIQGKSPNLMGDTDLDNSGASAFNYGLSVVLVLAGTVLSSWAC